MSKDETIDPEISSKLRFLRKSFEESAGGPQAPHHPLKLPSQPLKFQGNRGLTFRFSFIYKGLDEMVWKRGSGPGAPPVETLGSSPKDYFATVSISRLNPLKYFTQGRPPISRSFSVFITKGRKILDRTQTKGE